MSHLLISGPSTPLFVAGVIPTRSISFVRDLSSFLFVFCIFLFFCYNIFLLSRDNLLSSYEL